MQGTKQGSGRQASDPLQLDLWIKGFLKRKDKEARVNHSLVTVNHSFGSQDVSGLIFSGMSVAQISVSSSCPGETT